MYCQYEIINDPIFELLKKCDKNYLILEKFKKFEIIRKIEKYLLKQSIDYNGYLPYINIEEDKLQKISSYLNIKKLKLNIKYFSKPKPYSHDYFSDDESNLKESVKRLNHINNLFFWKPCREILKTDDVVILPNKIGYSNFNQDYIGDCYFISCVNALSQIPQLLNFIMVLSGKGWKNQDRYFFSVKFFIDGRWEIIYVKDSFP